MFEKFTKWLQGIYATIILFVSDNMLKAAAALMKEAVLAKGLKLEGKTHLDKIIELAEIAHQTSKVETLPQYNRMKWLTEQMKTRGGVGLIWHVGSRDKKNDNISEIIANDNTNESLSESLQILQNLCSKYGFEFNANKSNIVKNNGLVNDDSELLSSSHVEFDKKEALKKLIELAATLKRNNEKPPGIELDLSKDNELMTDEEFKKFIEKLDRPIEITDKDIVSSEQIIEGITNKELKEFTETLEPKKKSPRRKPKTKKAKKSGKAKRK